MIDKTGSHYRTLRSRGEGERSTIRRPVKGIRICSEFALIAVLLILAFPKSTAAVNNPPVLISEPNSTRAIAVESMTLTREPFALISPYGGSGQHTRVMIFAMSLILQPGEDLSVVSADAEDAAHRHYALTVEAIRPVPSYEWLSAVVFKLNDELVNVGDVLVSVSYRGVMSNRVRIAIGHVGGGPPDDPGATPTPVRPFSLSGQIRDDNNDPLGGVGVTLTDATDGSSSTATSTPAGSFSFTVLPGHNITVTPATTAVFSFGAQSIQMISSDRVLDFRATRRAYSIIGRLTGNGSPGLGGLTVNLGGFQNATTTSDNNGIYVFAGLPAGRNYTVTAPTTVYFTFVTKSFNDLSGDQVADLEGTLRYYTVSGHAQLGPNDAPGLAIQISGSQTLPLTTDDYGSYSVILPAGGNYTLTPSVTYYTFEPVAQFVTDLTSDQINRNFIGHRDLYTISGRLKDQDGSGLAGMTIRVAGAPLFGEWTRVTDQNGYYEFAGLTAGYDYVVTPPSTASYVFHAQGFPDLSSNQTFDFIGLRRLTLSGVVRDQSGNGLFGVRVNLSGSENAATITAADGSYSLIATATGNYTVTPSVAQDWYSFVPASAQFNNLATTHATDFSGTLALVPDPFDVLEFDGTPKSVDYGNFWQEGENLGHFFWEFWARPGGGAGATYMLSDGYGGAHALLFGVGSFNTSEPNRYELLGDIFDGVKFDNYFGSDQGPAVGEWAHFAVGWDGQNIITYYNGVPAGKTPFAGPRRTPGPGGGGGRLLIGGSDHSNFDGRIAQVRGYEDNNPREALPGGVETSFAPQTVFGLEGNLLSYFFRSGGDSAADLSRGYKGINHQGWVRGTQAGILFGCGDCPPPQYVVDPSAPNFVTNAAPSPVSVPSPAAVPGGALVFDSFSRTNSTYLFGSRGGLGSTEGGSAGTQVWQSNQASTNPQPFGILNARAVLLANSTAVAWVPTGSTTGDVDVRVNRFNGRWGSGKHTGLSFRVLDAANFFFAYTTDTGDTSSPRAVRVGYYLNGQRVDLTNGVAIPSSWTTLSVVTSNSGNLRVYIDGSLVFSTNNPQLASATGAGLYNNSSGLGLANRWDNFTVFNAP